MLPLVFAAALALTAPVEIVDGDTFDAGGVRYRIEGLDAPEVRSAACPAERVAGDRATEALRALLSTGPVAVEVHRTQPATSRYRERKIATVTVAGRDVTAAMISGGYGVRWTGRKHDFCAVAK